MLHRVDVGIDPYDEFFITSRNYNLTTSAIRRGQKIPLTLLSGGVVISAYSARKE